MYEIPTKELIYKVFNLDEFISTYDKITSENYKLNNEYIEGFVIEDINNFMVKTKTYYYDEWKHLRTKMENAMKTNKYKTKGDDKLEQSFMNYLKEKYQDKEVNLNKINIIIERNEFLKKSNIR